MAEAVIVDAVRTPVGCAGKGLLKHVRTDELAAVPLRALAERNPLVDLSRTVDVMVGCGNQSSGQNDNVARGAALLAGIDHRVPATTVNRSCASSLQTIRMAYHAIVAGEGDQFIAAGVEAASRLLSPEPLCNSKLDDPGRPLCDVYVSMGETAENVAQRRRVSREAQDEWAAISHSRAVAARDRGHFDREIVSVVTPDGNSVAHDDGPRPGLTREKLAELEPAFRNGRGTVTAGNAFALSDGAAAVLVMSARRAEQLGVGPRARIVASSITAVRPETMGLEAIPAARQVLDHVGLSVADMDVIELDEAFAAQLVACRDELGINPAKLNPAGGAIALGRPFGMTGARMMTTLLSNLDAVGGRFGLEAIGAAGGLGQAMIIERLS